MLTLTSVALNEVEQHKPTLDMAFNVVHNDGALPTSVNFDLKLQVDRRTGLVSASLLLDGLKNAPSIDDARLRMANWCTRMGAALRQVERVPADIPTYEKTSFDLAKQPSWVQAEFARLVPRLTACAGSQPTEERRDILDEMVAENNPLLNIYGAWEKLAMHSYADE